VGLTHIVVVIYDPYTPERSYYECRGCGSRQSATRMPESCPECGGFVRNIAVPRE